ncbi:Transcription initiation factor IIE subunit alpha [Leucoagaricus sp. SymC.cos]|nr:Transcription initiation factor IIE subunit alpha [Leucoagaricus sp. SymC.cos]
MATKEDQETLRLLVQYVSRAFYEPKYIIIMDQLARHPVLKDDDLAGRMGLQPKELNKIIAVLSNDCLVKVFRQNELKEGAQRSVGKQYYYIDYQHFCNVVKWRIAKIWHMIDTSLRNEKVNKGYICTLCKQSYSPLDVDKLMDFNRGIMVCEICHAEVVDNDNAESLQGSNDRMERFNRQVRLIREGLQKTESMVLPAFDVAAWIKIHFTDSESKKPVQGAQPGLKIAGSSTNGASQQDEGISIMMAMDKDESTRRQERAAEAELKRQQNALPAWHLKSTITGDLTALGIQETKRAEAAAAAAAAASGGGGNDEILRGLGIVGVPARAGGSTSDIVESPVVANGDGEDEKQKVGQDDADYYDQYYASLAASTTVSAMPTPTPARSSESGDYGYTIDVEDEEDRKPTIEYLDSLNDYRKRSRSKEDVDGSTSGGNGSRKLVKTDSEMSVNGHLTVNGYANSSATPEDVGLNVVGGAYGDESTLDGEDGYANGYGAGVGEGSGEPEDDPVVYVNGNPVPYSKVTEEDHELMTPDEYTAYFEIMQSRS